MNDETMNDETFHDPQHDHSHCARSALCEAERICAQKNARLTPIRRHVLEIILQSHRPIGAYDIIAHYAPQGSAPPAPITVYRALDFLMETGLVHRIESKNAYLACNHVHGQSQTTLFLICDHCGTAGEIDAAPLLAAVHLAAQRVGFMPHQSVMEIGGICAHCQPKII